MYDSMTLWQDAEYMRTEQYIIGAIVADERCLDDVRSLVRPEMFSNGINRGLFESACQLQDEGTAVDIVSVGAKYKAKGEVLPGDYVSDLVAAACTAADANTYCQILRKEYKRRCLLGDSMRWIEDLRSGEDPRIIAIEMADKMKQYDENEDATDTLKIEESVVETLNRASDMQTGAKFPSIPSGYKSLDHTLGGGFQKNGLYVLAARPGKGKTSLALNLSRNIAKNGYRVLFISLEMDDYQLTSKLIAADVGNISATDIMTGSFDEIRWDDIRESANRIGKLPIAYNKQGTLNIKDVRVLAKSYKPDFIVIDYLGLIVNENERGSLYEETTKKSKQLKQIAREMKCPILCLAQLNREVERSRDGKPMLSHLRDSGSIEQDADCVLFNYIEQDTNDSDLTEEQRSAPVELSLIVAKNRHGSVGTIPMYWDKVCGKITALQKKMDAYEPPF